jgi:hypothetical protein
MTNSGLPTSPRDLEGFSLLLALQTAGSETGARDKNSEDCETGGMSIGQWLLWTDWKCLAKASATALGSTKCAPWTSSWIEPDLCYLKLDMYFQEKNIIITNIMALGFLNAWQASINLRGVVRILPELHGTRIGRPSSFLRDWCFFFRDDDVCMKTN